MNSKNCFHHKISLALCGLLLLCSVTGCSENPRGNRHPTTQVTGQITVDGIPIPADQPLRIECHALNQSTAGLASQTLTGVDGRFEISTYEQGDGVPPGDYALTFQWGKMNIMSGSYDDPDRLGKKYQDIKTSTIKFTITAEQPPIDLGTITLRSSGL